MMSWNVPNHHIDSYFASNQKCDMKINVVKGHRVKTRLSDSHQVEMLSQAEPNSKQSQKTE